jgi:hypothetical protein
MADLYRKKDFVPYIIHKNLILHNNNLLVVVYLFLKYHEIKFRNIVIFRLDDLIEWCGYKVSRVKGGSREKFITALTILNDLGYISFDSKSRDKIKGSDKIECSIKEDTLRYYIDKSTKRAESGIYGIIYSGEIEKIINSSDSNRINIPTQFLVLAYLRSSIYIRKKTSDNSQESNISVHKFPEAYGNYYFNIARTLSITARSLSRAINILCDEYKIIYYSRAYIKIGTKERYVTSQTVFVNRYIMKNGNIVAGEGYYKPEIELKLQEIVNDIKNFYSQKDIEKNGKKEDNTRDVECRYSSFIELDD